jgi:hypothetical protein
MKIIPAILALLTLTASLFAGDSTATNPNPTQWIFMETAEPHDKGWWGVKVPLLIPAKKFSTGGFTVNYQIFRWMLVDLFMYGTRIYAKESDQYLSLKYGWLGLKFSHNQFNIGSSRLYWASGLRLWSASFQVLDRDKTPVVDEPFKTLLLYTTLSWQWKILRLHSQFAFQPGDSAKGGHTNFFITPGLDVELGKRVTLFWEYWYSPLTFNSKTMERIYDQMDLDGSPTFNADRNWLGLGWAGGRIRMWKGSYVDLGVLLLGGLPVVPVPIISFGLNWNHLRDCCCLF